MAVPVKDAQAFARVLADKLEWFFKEGRPEDVLLLYLPGHGDLDDQFNFYFVAKNSKSDRLISSGIDASLIRQTMFASLSKRQIIILDCCYNGAFLKNWIPRSASVGVKQKLSGDGTVILTASDAIEFAYEKKDPSSGEIRSLFTSRLVEGIKSGQADLDGDGFISIDELYNYVVDRIACEDPAQKPVKSGSVHGQLWIGQAVGVRTGSNQAGH